ncbi:FG-GAP repeat protein, partial [Streptomyces sp900105245]
VSSGSSFSPAVKWHDRMCVDEETCAVGDVNGDGFEDVISFVKSTQEEPGQGDVWVGLSSRTADGGPANHFEQPVKWSEFMCIGEETCAVSDVNGDGSADALAFVKSTDGSEPAKGDVYIALAPTPPSESPSSWQWASSHTRRYNNHDWTEEAQGITTDGLNWYVTSNNGSGKRLYKFGPDFPRGNGTIVSSISLPGGEGHLGPPSFDATRKQIVMAVEPASVWAVDASSMKTKKFARLGGNGPTPQKTSIPWVAVSPIDGMLYSSVYGDKGSADFPSADRINVYDPDNSFNFVRSIKLAEPSYAVQGGFISKTGHIYLSSEKDHTVRGYSLKYGSFLGAREVDMDDTRDGEMEGLTSSSSYIWGEGDESQIAVLLLDNDDLSQDDIIIQFFRANPELL